MMTAVSTKAVTSTIDAVVKANFPVIACYLFYMTLVVVVTEDTLLASRNFDQWIVRINATVT